MLSQVKQMPAYLRLMRVDRPIGTYLVAWPALWALWFAAEGFPGVKLLLVFLAGAFLMRSAGCVINDYADRNIDAHVERTKARPLARGEVAPKEALALFVLLCALAASLLLLTNSKTVLLALLAAAITTIYPFMKRHTHWPQLVLGMAFSCAVPMAFAAATNHVPLLAWLLYTAVVLWVIAYDTYYAMVDRDDDLRIGVKSTAILFGRHDRSIIALLQVLFITLMIAAGLLSGRSILYYAGLIFASFLFVYQHVSTAQRDHERCFAAFLQNNYVGMAIFIGIAADTALLNALAALA
ncbi:MAG: 4-hydroxybenzoate octaprenyltransferase [Pseudomonadales bacterium]|nr:4-hydroxybenzoate octaprenyltransferase [Gammaproteobacteria bacterium]NNL57183.1 4-hydroxybenzoate octaprenyltransferase [Pseudomonadales bacterium]